VTFNTAGTYYWAAFYSGDGNNNAAVSGCSTETLVVSQPHVAQITPTNTTCQQFLGGTAGTLTAVDYQTKNTAKITNAQPGVFFYYVQVIAPSSSFTVNIAQAVQTGTGPLFGISMTTAYNSSCTNFMSIKITPTSAGESIAFSNAVAGQTYVVGVKYSPKSIVGQPKPNPANITYDFSAKLGTTVVPGSAQALNLVKTG
jgi:hypothetical protein